MTKDGDSTYSEDARRTLTRSFFGENVATSELIAALVQFATAAERLDRIKKRAFYGKDISEADIRLCAMQPYLFIKNDKISWNEQEEFVLHGVLGIATEAGELVESVLETVKEKLNGYESEFDLVNLIEEGGDVFWYLNALAIGANSNFKEMQDINIQKLRKRYPEKFTCDKAINRDAGAERALMEEKLK